MSAGVCGKRLGFDEIFGSNSPSSPSPAPPSKRSRRNRYGSPSAVDSKISLLHSMFPSMDREVVETVFKTHNDNIDDAIKSLNALCLGNEALRNELASLRSVHSSADASVDDELGGTTDQSPEPTIGNTDSSNLNTESSVPKDLSSWVDIFVQEMMSAANWDDVGGRARRFLEVFEKNVLARSAASKEMEIASMREQLQCLLRDNQILKKAVAIQHERNSEIEEKLKEVPHLKHIVNQYQEQVRTLEMNNYTLKVHLQRAQEANSVPNRFHPDIF